MFEREDWELFRTIEGLCSRAGVSRDKIAMLVAKELTDNALDTGMSCKVGLLDGGAGFFVQDDGSGLDPTQVADLFSIKRPMRSTKLLRLPTRGALGNGLRVVAGAVLATGGSLKVYTRGQALNLVPCPDGSTTVEVIGTYNGEGTRVEVHLGPDAGSINRNTLNWACQAQILSGGENYKGKTSPWWYTSRDFYELCLAAKDITIRDLVSEFEGCSNSQITSGFKAKKACDITLDEAWVLLDRMRRVSKPVKASRLGYCNFDEMESIMGHYAKVEGSYTLVSDSGAIEIPFVIEAWTTFQDRASIEVHVNRTSITGEVAASHSKTKLHLSGCNLSDEGYVYTIDVGRRSVRVSLNIITPYMPITSTGKSPDLRYLRKGIAEVIEKSVRKAKRYSPKENGRRTQKQIVRDHLEEGIQKAGGGHPYSQRQLFYAIRPFLIKEYGKEPNFDTFAGIITEIENERGHDLPAMYRDDRGTIYHPHTRDHISLGTRMVESYEPPDWTFNKVLYIEKEGFFPVLLEENWPEKYDCALLTSKGQPTRAARDFIDGLKDSKEDVMFFCIHDADAAGTIIYQSLQEETEARPARKVKVINLGLEPEEGIDMGLASEDVEELKDGRAVADYVPPEMKEWLQTHRIELNAMSTPQFLQWLNDKMEKFGNGKLIPPEDILAAELRDKTREKLEQDIKDRILKENDAEGQIERALEGLKHALDEKAKELPAEVVNELVETPDQSWRDPVTKAAHNLVTNSRDN